MFNKKFKRLNNTRYFKRIGHFPYVFKDFNPVMWAAIVEASHLKAADQDEGTREILRKLCKISFDGSIRNGRRQGGNKDVWLMGQVYFTQIVIWNGLAKIDGLVPGLP